MSFLKPGIISDMLLLQIQKKIQMVLKKRGFWPSLGLKLNCKKQKCSSYQAIINCKLCTKKKNIYKSYLKLKKHSDRCDKSHIYNKCICYKKYCQYI